ncbi:MAG: orotate phosphoribosyltransferase [Deltaproteobacteria bacterium]|nr:orotate phosphoribosyltransferase [Deltaproteobacteria bacterium]
MGDRSKLKKLLLEKSLVFAPVTLASGKKSNYYIDVRQTALHAEGLYFIGKLIFEKLAEGDGVKAIGGPTLGADPICAAVGLYSYLQKKPLHAFIVRKEPKSHGLSQWIEGTKNLESGMSVALCEDVVTSGKSLWTAIEKAKEFGLSVKRVICIIDRGEGGSEFLNQKGYRLESLFKVQEFF